jgi:hypothetical protein
VDTCLATMAAGRSPVLHLSSDPPPGRLPIGRPQLALEDLSRIFACVCR